MNEFCADQRYRAKKMLAKIRAAKAKKREEKALTGILTNELFMRIANGEDHHSTTTSSSTIRTPETGPGNLTKPTSGPESGKHQRANIILGLNSPFADCKTKTSLPPQQYPPTYLSAEEFDSQGRDPSRSSTGGKSARSVTSQSTDTPTHVRSLSTPCTPALLAGLERQDLLLQTARQRNEGGLEAMKKFIVGGGGEGEKGSAGMDQRRSPQSPGWGDDERREHEEEAAERKPAGSRSLPASQKSSVRRWQDVSRFGGPPKRNPSTGSFKDDAPAVGERRTDWGATTSAGDGEGEKGRDGVGAGTGGLFQGGFEGFVAGLLMQLEIHLDRRLQGIETKLESLQELLEKQLKLQMILTAADDSHEPFYDWQRGSKQFNSSVSTSNEEARRRAVYEFCQHVLKLPEDILKKKTVYEFFSQDAGNIDISRSHGVSRSKSAAATETKNGRDSTPNGDTALKTTTVTGDKLKNPRKIRKYEEIDITGARATVTASSNGIKAELVTPTEPAMHLPLSESRALKQNSVDQSNVLAQLGGTLSDDVIGLECNDNFDSLSIKSSKISTPSTSPNIVSPLAPQSLRLRHQISSTASQDSKPSADGACARSPSTALGTKSGSPSQPCSPEDEGPTCIIANRHPPVREKRSGKSRIASHQTSVQSPQSSGLFMTIPPMPLSSPPKLSEQELNEEHENRIIEVAENSGAVSPGTGAETGAGAGSVAGVGVSAGAGEVHVVAVADYSSSSDNILTFKAGSVATLVIQSDSNWWCVRLDTQCGWVPAEYWRMLNSGDCGSVSSRSGTNLWFAGKMSRIDCETLLIKHGKQRHFFVRESTNLPGHYALSIKYNHRVHHFPIEVTPDGKYNIGKHDFKTVTNIISYYKRNPLFYDDEGAGVTLGSPLVVAEEKPIIVTSSLAPGASISATASPRSVNL